MSYEKYLNQVKNRELYLRDVPDEYLDKNMWKAGVMANDEPRLRYVPEEFIDREMAVHAVRRHSDNFLYTPEEFIDHDFCKNLSNQMGGFRYVPKKFRGYDMYLHFAKNNCNFILEEVPKEFLDKNMWRTAVLGSYAHRLYDEIPREYIDDEFARELSRFEVRALKYIEDLNYDDCYNAVQEPEHLQSYYVYHYVDKKMCLKVMKGKLREIECVPENLRDEEMYLLAYNNGDCSEYALGVIPDEYITYEMCLRDIKIDGDILRRVPKRFVTLELCQLALKQSLLALQFVPEEYKTKDLCLGIIEKDMFYYEFIPDEYKTPELSLKAVSKYSHLASCIPKDHFCAEIAEIIVKHRIECLEYVPDHLKTYELLKKGRYHKVLKYFPEEILDKEICEEYVKMDCKSFKFIPDKFKDYKMCIRLCRIDQQYMIYVPDHLKQEVSENL